MRIVCRDHDGSGVLLQRVRGMLQLSSGMMQLNPSAACSQPSGYPYPTGRDTARGIDEPIHAEGGGILPMYVRGCVYRLTPRNLQQVRLSERVGQSVCVRVRVSGQVWRTHVRVRVYVRVGAKKAHVSRIAVWDRGVLQRVGVVVRVCCSVWQCVALCYNAVRARQPCSVRLWL